MDTLFVINPAFSTGQIVATRGVYDLACQNPDFAKIQGMLKEPVIFDGRNIYSIRTMKTYGLKYFPIGRPSVQ